MDAELRQRFLVSMRGIEPWRLYREGAPASLTLDMFPAPRLSAAEAMHGVVSRQQEGIIEVLTACRRTAEFGTHMRLATRIRREVMAGGIGVKQQFEQETFYLRELGFVMRIYGAGKRADEGHLLRLTSFLVRTNFSDTDRYPQAYAETMGRVWFAMCDTAARIPVGRVMT